MATVHEATEQGYLSIAKLAAARDTATAVLTGKWDASPEVLDALANLVRASADHARRAA